MKKYVFLAVAIIAVTIIAFYVFGVEPTNIESVDAKVVDKNVTELNITGKSEPYAIVTVNGEPATVDKDGKFYKIINLKNGTNTVTITTKAPFKSEIQTNGTSIRKEDKNGVEWSWNWNYSYEY